VSSRDGLEAFVRDALEDAGAEVSEEDGVLWVHMPPGLATDLDAPGDLRITLDPEVAARTDAELLAPGSYLLERVLAFAIRRGRWDAARFEPPGEDWVGSSLAPVGLASARFIRESTESMWILLFPFRLILESDEKRESIHVLAVPADGSEAWEVPEPLAEAAHPAALWPSTGFELTSLYRAAGDALAARTAGLVESFRRESLARLEEEVRRILGYFDRTVAEIREADPSVADDVVRTIEGERDRRLVEALERHEPRVRTVLVGVRAVLALGVRGRLRLSRGRAVDVRIDAFTGRVRGVSCEGCGGKDPPWSLADPGRILCAACAATAAGSVRPRGGPPSDTPRRRRRPGPAGARSPRGSRAQSRSAPARGRTP